MRVLAITNLYPNPLQPHRAPFNRHQFRLLNDTYPVRVIAPISWTDERTLRKAGGEPIPKSRVRIQDGLTVVHPRYFFPPKIGRGWYGHCFARSIRSAFRRAVAEFRPDVVFAPWAYPDGWAAGRLAQSIGLPVVIQVHGSDVLLLEQFPARKRPTVEALTAADGVVAVSRDLANKVEALGVVADRIRVVYDGVDPSLFAPGSKDQARARLGLDASGPPVVLFVGNLVPVKAVDVLLAAAELLQKAGTPIRLVLVGAGPLRAPLEKQAASAGLAVQFVGSVPQTDLPDWYRAADLFVLPSHSEGVPNVLLEASACGTPWVASRVGGIPEIAHLGCSTLVPPNSPPELAAAIGASLKAGHVPAVPPRLRTDAVAELAAFLASFAGRPRKAP